MKYSKNPNRVVLEEVIKERVGNGVTLLNNSYPYWKTILKAETVNFNKDKDVLYFLYDNKEQAKRCLSLDERLLIAFGFDIPKSLNPELINDYKKILTREWNKNL